MAHSPDEVVVPDLLARRAASDPDVVALMVEDRRSLTYWQWDRRSAAVGRGLAARGVGRGDAVALVYDTARWDDYAVAYLGVHKAGAAAVPLSPAVAGPDLARILAHCRAVGVVCPLDLSPEAPPGGSQPWVAQLEDLETGQLDSPFQVPLEPSDLAEIVYTSGTTGRPKGVACSHASIVVHDGPPEPEGPRVKLLHAFPVGTNAAQELCRIALRRGDRLPVTMARFDPERCAALVESLGIARLQLVPSMAAVLVGSGAWRGHDLSSVKVVTLSSAPAPPALLAQLGQALPRARLVNAYALTESGTARTLNLDARSRPGSVGRPVGLTELRIAGDDGSALPAGQTGEVWLRRPGAPPRSYFRDPEATAAAFAGGWLHTGDLGWVDGDGELHLADRSKDVIICGGLNVSSLEVEDVLYEHPDVVEAAVVGVPHAVLGQDVGAAVVVGRPTEARDLQAFARLRLAEHKVPHHIAFVDTLPRTASGKVRKTGLAAVVEAGAGGGGAGGPGAVRPGGVGAGGDGQAAAQATARASGHEEKAIAAIWADVLGVETVGAHDDFFSLGGHSLAAAQVLARVEEDLGVTLPLSTLFEGPTVAELARAVTASSAVSR